MYYEEKVIDGVLCWRNKPGGQWTPFANAQLTARLLNMEDRISDLENKVEQICPTIK